MNASIATLKQLQCKQGSPCQSHAFPCGAAHRSSVLQTTVIEEDREFVHSYFDMPDEDFPINRQSPWLLRITLNRDLMVDKKLSLEAIAERINTEFEDELHCIFNDDNAEVPALRVCRYAQLPSQALSTSHEKAASCCRFMYHCVQGSQRMQSILSVHFSAFAFLAGVTFSS
jgi:hypothetical protein